MFNRMSKGEGTFAKETLVGPGGANGCLDRACEGIIAYQPPTRMVGAETDGVPVRDDGLELFLIDLATGHQQSHFLCQEYGGRGVKKMRG